MNESIVVALIAFVGTLIGSISGVLTTAKLTAFRLERLERKVDLHNNAIERLAIVECRLKKLEE